MERDEFFKRKIFFKASIPALRKQYPQLSSEIDNWSDCDEYKLIQGKKTFLRNKLKEYIKQEELDIMITDEMLYELYTWWKSQPKKCYYCELPEADLEALRSLTGHINKRYPQRGKSLELDRKDPHGSYLDTNNLALACYWCNNAKTDTFTEQEFIMVGRLFKEIWEARLGKNL